MDAATILEAIQHHWTVENRLRRALDNLLSNAIKYTPVGGQVAVLAEQQDSRIAISVKDTGIGIPTPDLPHIFERFYRVKDRAHREAEGTGLGLAIVKSIVERHQGAVDVNSDEGGSTFTIHLPVE